MILVEEGRQGGAAIGANGKLANVASFRLASIQFSIARCRSARRRQRRHYSAAGVWIDASDSINEFASVMLTFNL